MTGAPPASPVPGEAPNHVPVVFISYARPDRARIDRLTRALSAAGHQVWWDALIEGGEAFAKTIETALDLADAVVVAWSAHSVSSDWVRDEAAHGRDRGRLVPISLDGTAPPLGFRQYHFIDFSRWSGSAESAEVAALCSAIAAAGQGHPPAASAISPRQQAPSRRKVLIGAGLGAIALGGGFAAWRTISMPRAIKDSIAVLTFANLSGDPAQAYFSDGLTEELRDKLAEVAGFKVAARTSSDHFQGKDHDVGAIGQALGVAWLLDGSVRRAGDALRVSVELIEIATGLSKWAQSYDRKFSDVFAVQSDIAITVIQAITGTIPEAADALRTSGTTVVAAYDACLKGIDQYNSASGAEGDRAALASFDAAIAADPNYALAYAMRAATLFDLAGDDATPLAEAPKIYADGRTSVQRAIDLAPNTPLPWLVRGDGALFETHNFRDASVFYDKAYAIGPNNKGVLGDYAMFDARRGHVDRALTIFDRLIDDDRLNAQLYAAKGRLLYFAHNYADAARLFGQALAMTPGINEAQFYIGLSLYARGQFDAARQAFAADSSERARLGGLALLEARSGKPDGSLAALKGKFGDNALWFQALAVAQTADRDRALGLLEQARAKNASGISWIGIEPLLDHLRGEPRFKRLLASLGLA